MSCDDEAGGQGQPGGEAQASQVLGRSAAAGLVFVQSCWRGGTATSGEGPVSASGTRRVGVALEEVLGQAPGLPSALGVGIEGRLRGAKGPVGCQIEGVAGRALAGCCGGRGDRCAARVVRQGPGGLVLIDTDLRFAGDLGGVARGPLVLQTGAVQPRLGGSERGPGRSIRSNREALQCPLAKLNQEADRKPLVSEEVRGASDGLEDRGLVAKGWLPGHSLHVWAQRERDRIAQGGGELDSLGAEKARADALVKRLGPRGPVSPSLTLAGSQSLVHVNLARGR